MNLVQFLTENMWSITLGLLLVVIYLWFRWRKRQFSLFKDLGIPGPEPNILFGNLWEMTKSPITCHKEWVAKYGKVVGYYFGGTPTLLVADVELVKKILVKDFNKFVNRPQLMRRGNEIKKTEPFGNQLIALKDKRWKEIRSIITPSFTTSKMRMMSQTINGAVDSLLAILDKKSKEGKSFDMYMLFKGLTMDVIGRTAFGIQTDCQNNPEEIILKATKTIFAGNLTNFLTIIAISFPELGSFWQKVNRLRLIMRNRGRNPIIELMDIAKDIIQTRRANSSSRRQDLLQIMIDAGISESDLNKITDDQLTAGEGDTDDQTKKTEMTKDSGSQLRYMVDREIIDNSLLFILAGYETTSTALGFTTHFLLHYPELQKKIRDEIQEVVEREGKLDYNAVQQLQYLDQVLSESLRMYPPVHLFVNRVASEDVQYGPYKIPKGMFVQIPVYNLNHDPDLWPEPEKFDPSRFSPEKKSEQHHSMAFLSFGAGPRNCVGMRFAQLEAKLALARILQKYELLTTDETDPDPITLKVNVASISPGKGINLKVKPV